MTKPASAPPAALQRVSEIEDAIAAGTMSAAQVFTQMRQLVAASAQVREVDPDSTKAMFDAAPGKLTDGMVRRHIEDIKPVAG
jgi:hypothetical protein